MRLQCIQDLPWHRLFLTKSKNQTVAIIQQAWTTNAQDRKTDQSMWEMTATYTSCLCVSTSLHSRNDEISCSTDLWAGGELANTAQTWRVHCLSNSLNVGVTRYFCLIKCSLCQIRWLKSHKFWPCHGRETWQAARCSLINHCLQFMMCEMSLARERSSLTTTTDKSSWKVNKKSNMLVVLLWGVLDAASAVVHYDTLHKMKWSTVAPGGHWSFSELTQRPTSSQSGFYQTDIV